MIIIPDRSNLRENFILACGCSGTQSVIGGRYSDQQCLWRKEHVEAVHITEDYEAENKAETIAWA